MASLDEESLLTDKEFSEIICLCTNVIYNDIDTLVFDIFDLLKHLLLANKKSYFLFNLILCKKEDDTAKKSSTVSNWADTFTSLYEISFLDQYLVE